MGVLEQPGSDTFPIPARQDVELINPTSSRFFACGEYCDNRTFFLPQRNLVGVQQNLQNPLPDIRFGMRGRREWKERPPRLNQNRCDGLSVFFGAGRANHVDSEANVEVKPQRVWALSGLDDQLNFSLAEACEPTEPPACILRHPHTW
jgi:hypothetical protein